MIIDILYLKKKIKRNMTSHHKMKHYCYKLQSFKVRNDHNKCQSQMKKQHIPFYRKQVKSAPNQIGPKSNRPQSNRPLVKSAPSQIGPKSKLLKNKNCLVSTVVFCTSKCLPMIRKYCRFPNCRHMKNN